MRTELVNEHEVVRAIDEAMEQLRSLVSSLNEKQVNTAPYPGSWTAGQLFRHVTKSTAGIAKAMRQQTPPVSRYPGERIPQLKKTFLDFSIQMQSPDFIALEAGPYEKAAIMDEMKHAFEALKENSRHTDLCEVVEGLPLGTITKWEMLHFILYHTQRHLHQMKKIRDALANQSSVPA